MMKLRKLSVLTTLAAVFTVLLTSGPILAQNFGPSGKDFEKFITYLAEINKKSQLNYVDETLIEHYEQNCQEKSRRVKKSVTAKWDHILAGKAMRKKKRLSFKAESTGQGRGEVILSQDGTWLYGYLYFTWDTQRKNWRMTGCKFDMAETGDCL
jgi:hypothetical protein